MGSSTRYVSLGLLIGASVTALFVVGIVALGDHGLLAAPSPTSPPTATPCPMTATPTSVPSATPTFTAVPTLIEPQLSPEAAAFLLTSTPDVVAAAISKGDVVFTGPLSNPQQVALYRASLNYVRSTVTESRRLAKEVNGVGYGDPTNICGPLAVAILRDAGLLSADISPHDFWLLNPPATTDQRVINKAFPASEYEHTRILTPINRVNWRDSPLYPGDFLFIWHGSGGNFDHMLVVNRVDSQLRAYAVTNFGTPDGYIIAEALLYDPADPKAGLFHTWTREREALLGSTGFGGFELWRSSSE